MLNRCLPIINVIATLTLTASCSQSDTSRYTFDVRKSGLLGDELRVLIDTYELLPRLPDQAERVTNAHSYLLTATIGRDGVKTDTVRIFGPLWQFGDEHTSFQPQGGDDHSVLRVPPAHRKLLENGQVVRCTPCSARDTWIVEQLQVSDENRYWKATDPGNEFKPLSFMQPEAVAITQFKASGRS